MLASWSCEGVVFLVLLSSSHLTTYHVLSLSLSGLNWRSLPAFEVRSPFPQNGAPIHRVRAHSLTRVHDSNVCAFIIEYLAKAWTIYTVWTSPKTLDYGTGGYTDKLEEMVAKTRRGLRLRLLNGLEGYTCTRFFTSGNLVAWFLP